MPIITSKKRLHNYIWFGKLKEKMCFFFKISQDNIKSLLLEIGLRLEAIIQGE